MANIKQLPPDVVNKIAAGEVIERPASVVKELIENAVDAGSTRIDVSLEKGGAELVRVVDNGCGIAAHQLTLAVASHATSKIRGADDLFRMKSLGFRGEALASIASISQFVIRSRAADSDVATEMEVLGGRVGDPEPCGGPVGTTIEVRNLFYNTPVRRKFLRKTQTEMGHVSEAFIRVALAYHQVHFSLRHNDRTIYELPPVTNWRERIKTFFGDDLADALIAVESHDGDLHLRGYVADPAFSRANNRMQYLLLNGRHIKDRSLQHALSEAYRGLLLTGRFPIAFLKLEMPPQEIDVNVHPTKLEVRFQDGGRIYSQLLATLRKKFLSSDLTARVQEPTTADEGPAGAHDRQQAATHRRNLVSWAKGAGDQEKTTGTQPPAAAQVEQSRLSLQYAQSTPLPPFKPFGQRDSVSATGEAWSSSRSEAAHPGSSELPTTGEESVDTATEAGIGETGMQLQDRYLITETDGGIVIIDQHALHERVLYEQLREKVLSGKLEMQRLLVPEPVHLTPAEAAVTLDARASLVELGIEIERFSGDTILVLGYPVMLANLGPAEVLRQVVEKLMESEKQLDRRDLLDELLHMSSCKAAVKAGDRLTGEEITALLQQRHLFHDTHHCPHGRPTALVFSNEELDKRFKRI